MLGNNTSVIILGSGINRDKVHGGVKLNTFVDIYSN